METYIIELSFTVEATHRATITDRIRGLLMRLSKRWTFQYLLHFKEENTGIFFDEVSGNGYS